ncbi:MAG: MmgE/PrpD family protein [Burkholderiales bacterium]
MTGLTRALAHYVCSSEFDRLRPEIQHEGVRAFVNWVGGAASGSREDGVQKAIDALSEFSSAGTCVIVGRGERLDPLSAAFVNSMSSGILTFNDTHFRTVAHPTSSVAAALLALAERQTITGEDFVHALILGDEIQCRIGNILFTPPAECGVGLSMTGLAGPIGTAVAAGKVMGFDESRMIAAIGLAANQAGGIREAHGTMASHFTQGHAARCGLTAAMFAARGFACTETMIEGPKGFAASYGTNANLDAALDKLGESFEISTLAYKPYPCGFVIHPIIDVCLEIAKTERFDHTQIERIELTVNPLAVQLTSRPEPSTRGLLQTSLQHWAAASFVYKAAGIAEQTEDKVNDPAIVNLRRKIVLKSDASVAREAAYARVLLRNGTVLEERVLHCRGSEGRPMSDDDISVKTLAQLELAFDRAKAEELLAACWCIAEYPSVDVLANKLATNVYTKALSG